jgi:hypothetical protein
MCCTLLQVAAATAALAACLVLLLDINKGPVGALQRQRPFAWRPFATPRPPTLQPLLLLPTTTIPLQVYDTAARSMQEHVCQLQGHVCHPLPPAVRVCHPQPAGMCVGTYLHARGHTPRAGQSSTDVLRNCK